MLHTFLTQRLGARFPVVNAPMTPAADGRLARAVVEAGGVGMLGVGESWHGADVAREAAIARGADPAPRYGIGCVGWILERDPELLEAAIAARPALITISFADVAPYAERVRGTGILLASQVQSRPDAERALAAGVDVLVAQGTEAGGHTGHVSTITMLQIALGLTERPVLAAGGIATPQGLAAVLGAGAQGAFVGTPFLLAREANVPEAARPVLAAARESDTVLTSLFDRVLARPWPARFPGRALRNDFSDAWHDRQDDAARNPAAVAAYEDGRRRGDYRISHLYAGESVGFANEVRTAADIVSSLGEGAEAILRTRLHHLLGDGGQERR